MTVGTTAAPAGELLSAAFRHDPYPVLRQLRQERPVHYSSELRAWLVTRYDDVVAGLADPAVSADRISPRLSQFPAGSRAAFDSLAAVLARWPLMLDRPEHTRFRAPLTHCLSRTAVEQWRPLVQDLVDRIFDTALRRGKLEVMADLAVPLPLGVVSAVLGVPAELTPLLKRCAVDIVDFFGTPPAAYLPRAYTAMRSIDDTVEALRSLVRLRRKSPQRDLISQLAAGAGTAEDDVVANCIMMVFAGFETTTNLIGNGILALLSHPEQFALLRNNPGLMRNAVNEMLRYESPVQRLSRMAAADLTIRGQRIRRGSLVFFMAGAANRDPAVFTDPDRFDITRDSGRQIAFGHWIHTCPGSTLAHLETDIVLTALCRRTPQLRLATTAVRWRPNLSVRALESLPTQLSPN